MSHRILELLGVAIILSQPNDLVKFSEQSASKLSDLVISICEMKSLDG